MAEGVHGCSCGCACLVVDEAGQPYAIGQDAWGNAAIVVPHAEAIGCGVTEFFFESTSCPAFRMFPLVSPAPFTYRAGTITLSYPDDGQLVVELRVNGLIIGQGRVPTGQTVGGWDAGVVPFSTLTGDRVEVRVVSAGTLGPAVNCAMVTCLGFDATVAPASLETTLHLPAVGTLTPGQTPASIGLAALNADIGTISRFNGQGRPTSVWMVRQDAAGTGAEWWEFGSSSVAAGGGGLSAVTAALPLSGSGTNQSPVRLVDGTVNGDSVQWNGSAWVVRRVAPRIDLYLDASHNAAAPAPPKLRFVRDAGTVYVDAAGVWTRHLGTALAFEIINHVGAVLYAGSIPANTWSVTPAASFTVDAGAGVAVRTVAPFPTTPGYGLDVALSYVKAG